MNIIGSGVLEAGKKNAAYFSYPLIMADLDGSNGLRTEFKAVGLANVPGRLSYSIATGMAKFGGDYVVPDMLHAIFLRNPHGRAKIKSMDISKAKALEGVVDILRWDDPDVLVITVRLR